MIWNSQLMKSSLNEFCKKTVCVPNVMTICSQCTLSLTPENITLFWMSLWRASLQYGLMCDIQIYLHFCFKIKQLRKETGKKLHNTLKNWVIVTLAYIKQKKKRCHRTKSATGAFYKKRYTRVLQDLIFRIKILHKFTMALFYNWFDLNK